MLRVAIDGPGGTGKSTIAKKVADICNLEYVDTGAMYRAIGLKSIEEDIDPTDEDSVEKMLSDTEIDFKDNKIYLDARDVSLLIRTDEISLRASTISKLPKVREKVNFLSKKIASSTDVVMEGRDIGTSVIPDAEVKIFMTADTEIRAMRRYRQFIDAGKSADYEEIKKDLEKRYLQDSTRAVSPLKQAEDSILLDTSSMDLEENIQAVVDIVCDAKKKYSSSDK